MTDQIKRPDRWQKFKDPYNNLLYGIILQAAIDTGGYFDEKTFITPEKVKEFIDTTGKDIFNYLKEQERY